MLQEDEEFSGHIQVVTTWIMYNDLEEHVIHLDTCLN